MKKKISKYVWAGIILVELTIIAGLLFDIRYTLGMANSSALEYIMAREPVSEFQGLGQ